jgi:hypothetical protein
MTGTWPVIIGGLAALASYIAGVSLIERRTIRQRREHLDSRRA